MASKTPDDTIIGFCDFCGASLLQDEDYGTEELTLCESCSANFYGLLNFMIAHTKGKPKQLELPGV